jgi:hypothetical protein
VKKYEYFISYEVDLENDRRYKGNICISFDRKITNGDDVKNLIDSVKLGIEKNEKIKTKNMIITWFKYLGLNDVT